MRGKGLSERDGARASRFFSRKIRRTFPSHTHASLSAVRKFQETVWKYYKENARKELPWRKTRDPYYILVSEIMLQQTQVDRVKPFYLAFIKKFPTIQKLSTAPLADVLKIWQGLGYNSRAKRLQDTAKAMIVRHDGIMPKDTAMLEALPGIGPYTSKAIVAFAYNHDAILIETNIRTTISHHFFHDKEGITDEQILKVLKRVLPKGKSREWYSALMDYGSHLKRSGIRINNKSKTYTRQSKFTGSDREARGVILKALAKNEHTKLQLLKLLGETRKYQLETQHTKLLKEGLIEKQKRGSRYQLPR